MKFPLFSLAAILLLTGCGREYKEFIRYHDSGRAKPHVALVPVIDHSNNEVPWDISNELTAGIRDRIMREGVLYLSTEQTVRSITHDLDNINLKSKDLSWAKQYAPHDFVAVIEVIQHSNIPYERQKVRPVYPADGEISKVLMMKARLKVIDIRGEAPKVILSQIVHSNHLIPQARASINYEQIPWDSDAYPGTPLGMAHARLARDVVAQLEHYIDTYAR